MSHDDTPLTPAERELEAAMSRLRPAGSTLDPLQVAFDAGKASAARSLRTWRIASVALLFGVIGALVFPAQDPRDVELVRSAPAQMQGAHDMQLASYLSLRNDVLERGVSVLPDVTPASRGAVPIRAGGSL